MVRFLRTVINVADNDVLADAIVIAKSFDGDENKTRIIPMILCRKIQKL